MDHQIIIYDDEFYTIMTCGKKCKKNEYVMIENKWEWVGARAFGASPKWISVVLQVK